MNYKRNIRRVFWIYFALFFLLSCWILKFIFIDAKNVAATPYNPRINLADSRVKRGDVLDSDRNILAETLTQASGYNTRSYPRGKEFAHIVGFSGYNSQGVEAIYALDLLKIDGEISRRIKNITDASPIKGNTAVLTIDSKLQAKAFELLNGKKGAIIAIEPSTGKILACASNPSFDPNRTAIEWDGLKSDSENNPLINRATQGLYPPGSIFKIVTLTAAMRYMPSPSPDSGLGQIAGYEDFTYTCKGEETFNGKTIRCYNGKAHGELDYKSAFAKSCNSFFAVLGETVGAENLAKTADELLFNTAFSFPLEYVKSSFVLNDKSDLSETVETSIGQGKTLVTPLHMASLVSAIANDGYLMQPYIVDIIETPSGKNVNKELPKISKKLFTSEECVVLTEIMAAVTTEGTASQLAQNPVTIAGKTGTAQNSSGEDHGWFVAFAPASDPKIAVAVILENSGGSSAAVPVAKEIINLLEP